MNGDATSSYANVSQGRVIAKRTGIGSLLRGQIEPRVWVSPRRPMSVGLIAERAAELHGRVPIHLDKPFDWDPERRDELDYVEFAQLVEQMSAVFKEAGVKPWDRVAIVKSPNYDMQAICWAAARIGAIPAPISAGLDPEIIAVLLERLDSPFVVTDREIAERARLDADRLGKLTARVIGDVDGGIPVADLWGGSVPPPSPREDDEPMMITHTSSTTGISKLSVTTPRGVSFSVLIEQNWPFAHSRHELMASCISFVHVRAAITQMASMARGTALIGVADPNEETVARLFSKHGPTIVEAHPNEFVRWERLRDDPREPFRNIRIYFSTFDATHPRTIRRLLGASKRKLPLWLQCYGQTETQVISVRTYTRRGAARMSMRDSRSIGWTVPGVRARIADPDTGRRVPRGEAGMIQIKTRARSVGFVGTEEQYWARRHGEWFDTGDWGRRGRWGDLQVLDRVADRIEGVESCLWIEDVLLDRIVDAEEIVVVPDKLGRAVPVVCMRDGKKLDRATWEAACEGIQGLEEPFEVSPTDLYRTATVKARRYLLTELIDRAEHDRANAGEVRPEVLLRDGR